MDGEVRDGPKGPQVRLLALRLLDVAGSTADQRREVPDAMDAITRQQLPAEGVEVEPAGGEPFRHP
jgi:phage protein D